MRKLILLIAVHLRGHIRRVVACDLQQLQIYPPGGESDAQRANRRWIFKNQTSPYRWRISCAEANFTKRMNEWFLPVSSTFDSSVFTLSVQAGRHQHFYRRDYTYFEDFDAFYKLQWDVSGNSWNTAFMVCDNEGSQLFYPKEEGEWAIVKNLTSLLAEAPNTTSVLVGIHDEIGNGEFVTIDGQSTPSSSFDEQPTSGQDCVIMDMETGTYSLDTCISSLMSRIYICKKIDEKPCPTVDLGYKYAKEAKKCYKVHKRTNTWQAAWHTCFMEGGNLVTAENKAALDFLRQILSNDQRYFAGFRRIFRDSSYYTVKGERLEDSGFPDWNENEHSYDCGVIRRYDNYNTMYTQSEECQSFLPFVCEMQARTK